MRLAPDWRVIAAKAWSFRLMAVALVFTVAEAIVPVFEDMLGRTGAALLNFGVVASAMVARIVAQKGVEDEK